MGQTKKRQYDRYTLGLKTLGSEKTTLVFIDCILIITHSMPCN